MSHIFICYSTRDGHAAADQLVGALEAAGWRCWIGHRDVIPGRSYPEKIVKAIRESHGVVLLLTPAANESLDVLQEVQNAHEDGKLIVPVIVGCTRPKDGLRYFLGLRQQIVWTEAGRTAAVLGDVFGITSAGESRQLPLRPLPGTHRTKFARQVKYAALIGAPVAVDLALMSSGAISVEIFVIALGAWCVILYQTIQFLDN